ncbi:hypothetical protein Pcinc_001223 [Petrolisthes cinctipes]|uniref:Uncharacterized protein n=1 Tax=Petrolisthes cinctipes TaxID=88211 RepID=A0AAE1GNB7_PETCI|nr:hypothetical protein Pcinc_001223 [Petrolisthes cinctipes]
MPNLAYFTAPSTLTNTTTSRCHPFSTRAGYFHHTFHFPPTNTQLNHPYTCLILLLRTPSPPSPSHLPQPSSFNPYLPPLHAHPLPTTYHHHKSYLPLRPHIHPQPSLLLPHPH